MDESQGAALRALADMAAALQDGSARALLVELNAAREAAEDAIAEASLIRPVQDLQRELARRLDEAKLEMERAQGEAARLRTQAEHEAAETLSNARNEAGKLVDEARRAKTQLQERLAEAVQTAATAREKLAQGEQALQAGEALRAEYEGRVAKLRNAMGE